MEKTMPLLVAVDLKFNSDTLKKVADAGRLTEFVDTFPVLLASQVKANIVEQLAAGGFKVAVGAKYGFSDDPDGEGLRYGNMPPGPRPRADLGLATLLKVLGTSSVVR